MKNKEMIADVSNKIQASKTALEMLKKGSRPSDKMISIALNDLDEVINSYKRLKRLNSFLKFDQECDIIDPPGYYHDFVSNGEGKSTKVSIFDNHRFLFYALIVENYNDLLSPTSLKNIPFTLVTFDWHLDTVAPTENEKEDLRKLNLFDRKEVSLFTWNHLSPQNDTQILSAQYLNLINDAHIFSKDSQHNPPDEARDYRGNIHRIFSYKDFESLMCGLKEIESPVLLDIDLDFFTDKKIGSDGHERVEFDSNDENAFNLFKPNGALMSVIREKIGFVTIAKEPKCCGGVINSNIIANRILSVLFDGNIFARCNNIVKMKLS